MLVLASGGFGAYFAWTQAVHHGPALAVLAVTMALGLECAKPFAVEAIFACVRRFSIIRAAAMTLLAAVAVGYSLTAEVSLMATTRGDVTADREAAADARQMAKERHRRATAELATMEPSRPVGELEALLAGKDCGSPTRATRALCAELGRATRRAELQSRVDQAEADTTTRATVGTGDPGAVALSTLLAQFGVSAPVAVVSTWLVLVGVLALETGSALAVVLARSVDGPARRRRGPAVSTAEPESVPVTAAVDTPPEPVHGLREPRRRPKRGQARAAGAKDVAAAKIVDKLREQDGRATGSVRRLGAMLGERKSTIHNALALLAASGIVERVGSDLVLRVHA